jgi:hypothetical protein
LGVPPEAVTVALPVAIPKQRISVFVLLTLKAVGADTVAEAVAEQPLASDTLTVYVPAVKFMALAEFCIGTVPHV